MTPPNQASRQTSRLAAASLDPQALALNLAAEAGASNNSNSSRMICWVQCHLQHLCLQHLLPQDNQSLWCCLLHFNLESLSSCQETAQPLIPLRALEYPQWLWQKKSFSRQVCS